MYRITATIGRSSLDPHELEADCHRLLYHLPIDTAVTVDSVKAAIVVVMYVKARDQHALGAVLWGAQTLDNAMAKAEMAGPATIAHVEAERVPPQGDGRYDD